MQTPWSGARLDRLRLLGPALLAVALVLAACNNGSGGSGY
jgi:predicted small secreted protein